MMLIVEKIKFPKKPGEQLEPMEVVQNYTIRYHECINLLNCLPPSIEPRATGHIIEQIEMVKEILKMDTHMKLMVLYI